MRSQVFNNCFLTREAPRARVRDCSGVRISVRVRIRFGVRVRIRNRLGIGIGPEEREDNVGPHNGEKTVALYVVILGIEVNLFLNKMVLDSIILLRISTTTHLLLNVYGCLIK